MGKFKAALDSQKGKDAIEADAAAGGKIGAHGTPAFFINGKFLSGAQPYETFKAKIDEELKKADALVAKGTPKAKVYEAIMKNAKTEVPAAPAAPRRRGREGPGAGQDGVQGRAGQLAGQGAEERAADHGHLLGLPVPVLQARRADAEADREGVRGQGAAWSGRTTRSPSTTTPSRPPRPRWRPASQGKFWEMHDKLFDNNTALERASLEKYAEELGLNMAKFKADLDASKYKAQIEAETKEGQAVGVNGHAGRVHQRPQDLGRLPVRDVQEDRRRGAGQDEGGGKAVAKRRPNAI